MEASPFFPMMLDEHLITSVLTNDRRGVISHLVRGANVNTTDILTSLSPLMIACQKGYTSLIDVLLHYKADILLCNVYGRNSLKIALNRTPGKSSTDIIRILLSHLNIPDTSEDATGLTSIQYTVKNGDIATFQLMLDYGYTVDYDSAF